MVPGDIMLEPAVLVALVVLVVNDHALKGAAPAPITGILSGFAGIILVPPMLVAAVELVRPRSSACSLMPMAIACALVGTGYAAVELLPAATEVYRWAWGGLQWPGGVAMDLLTGAARHSSGIVPVAATRDPFDLVAVPALAVPLWVQARRVSRCSGRSREMPLAEA